VRSNDGAAVGIADEDAARANARAADAPAHDDIGQAAARAPRMGGGEGGTER
jgi:hypothetical protein